MANPLGGLAPRYSNPLAGLSSRGLPQSYVPPSPNYYQSTLPIQQTLPSDSLGNLMAAEQLFAGNAAPAAQKAFTTMGVDPTMSAALGSSANAAYHDGNLGDITGAGLGSLGGSAINKEFGGGLSGAVTGNLGGGAISSQISGRDFNPTDIAGNSALSYGVGKALPKEMQPYSGLLSSAYKSYAKNLTDNWSLTGDPFKDMLSQAGINTTPAPIYTPMATDPALSNLSLVSNAQPAATLNQPLTQTATDPYSSWVATPSASQSAAPFGEQFNLGSPGLSGVAPESATQTIAPAAETTASVVPDYLGTYDGGADPVTGGLAGADIAGGAADILGGAGSGDVGIGAVLEGGAAAAEGFGLGDVLAAAAACFITTAICQSENKVDDCEELEILRNWRDKWALRYHSDDVTEYYKVAPEIVAGINSRKDSSSIFDNLRDKYLTPIIQAVKTGDNIKGYHLYKEMVQEANKYAVNKE